MSMNQQDESMGRASMPKNEEYERMQKVRLEHFRTLFHCEPERIVDTLIQFVAEDVARLLQTIGAAFDRIDRLERHQHQDRRIVIPLDDLRRELGKIPGIAPLNRRGGCASWGDVLDATKNQRNPTG